jgi:nicotinate-nucleotide pyrophosphorylase (carboxylating)
MLDNMSVRLMSRCVEICAGRCRLEASGGVTLETVEAMAATGVDAISIGGLTHSAPAADLSLELD